MPASKDQFGRVEDVWRDFLSEGKYDKENRQRRLFRWLPGGLRCKLCKVPFTGAAAPFTRVIFGKRRSKQNPNFCSVCEQFAQKNQGGVEVEISMLFASVRDSPNIGEKTSAAEYRLAMNRFYRTVTRALTRDDALIDKQSGDEVAAIFAPGFVGTGHARRAVVAGLSLLTLTGHAERQGPWIPIGVGIHTGTTFFGTYRDRDGKIDIRVGGEMPKTVSRLVAEAEAGEMVVSAATVEAARMDTSTLIHRSIDMKDNSKRLSAWIFPSVD